MKTTATERIYLDLTGQPSTPPRWNQRTSAQEARGLAETCTLIAHRASEEGAPSRARRWALSAVLWKHRADYLEENADALSWLKGPARRRAMADRSRSAAVNRYRNWEAGYKRGS
jgi:hypothetical protein